MPTNARIIDGESLMSTASPDRKRRVLRGRLRPGDLVQNAFSLMVSSAGTAGLGIVFWAMATRLEAPSFVGQASAEIAAMILLSSLSQLGFGSTFERFLPIAGKQSKQLVVRGYSLCVAMAMVLSVTYVLLGSGQRFIVPTLEGRIIFILSVMTWTIFALQDAVLIALRSSRYVPIENILYSALKLALLPAIIVLSHRQGIFLSWILPVYLALVGVNWYIFRHRIPSHMRSTIAQSPLPSVKRIAMLATGGYITSILNIFLTSVVAIIIVTRLGTTQSAYFYLPAMIAGSLGQLLWNVNISFLVEASTTPSEMARHIKSTVRVTGLIVVPSLVLGEILAPQILSIFGTAYSHHGTALLRILLVSVLGTVITEFYASLAWLDQRVWWLAARELFSLVVYLSVLFALINHLGINAAGVAALTSSLLQAIFFLPSSIRKYRAAIHPVDEVETTANE